MYKNIKVQLSKSIHESKLETLFNSYKSLKSILTPNLTENNISFMTNLIELISSQLTLFVELLNLNEDKILYEKLNDNNQKLSKQIAYLYEFPRYQLNTKISLNSTSEKDKNENNKLFNNIENYSIEEKKENIKNKDNTEFNNNNTIESKAVEKNDFLEKKNEDEINNNIPLNNKIMNLEEVNEKLITKNNIIQEKNEIVRNLNFKIDKNDNSENINKEKVKNIQVKTQSNFTKKFKPKYKKENNKVQSKKKIIFPKSLTKRNLNSIKSNKYEPPPSNLETRIKKNIFKNETNDKSKEQSLKNIKDKKERQKTINNYNVYLKNDIKEQNTEKENIKIVEDINDKEDVNQSSKKFKRKGAKSKTVIFRSIQLPYFVGIETSENYISPEDNYISITFSNNLLENVKTPNTKRNKNKLVNLKTIENKSLFNSEFKKDKKSLNTNSEDYFSLDEFLIPNINKKGEKIFSTKEGNVLINQKQKDILEDYINNYLFDDDKNAAYEIERIPLNNKIIREKIKRKEENKNKHYVVKGTSLHYDLNDVTELLQMFPKSFKIPLDKFYLRKKKTSMFNRDIFKICHKVIDNYKILEGKEDIFHFKKSKSKPKYNVNLKNNSSNKKKYKNRNDKLYNNLYSS